MLETKSISVKSSIDIAYARKQQQQWGTISMSHGIALSTNKLLHQLRMAIQSQTITARMMNDSRNNALPISN